MRTVSQQNESRHSTHKEVTMKRVAAYYSETFAAYRHTDHIMFQHATDDYVTTATTTTCRFAVTVRMCFTDWEPGGCLNRVLC